MIKDNFDIIILLGRPASGKSEVIDFLKKTPVDERLFRFHIGKFEEIDDFPMLWTWFEEDAILEKILNKPRIHTDKEGYFLRGYQWHLLIERISLEYSKKLRQGDRYHHEFTTIIEFSRGSEHGGYAAAFPHLSDEILSKAGIVYINVSYEESKRKNRYRFNPQRPDSILEHGLPDEKLEKLYKEVDWQTFTAGNPNFLEVKGHKIPYINFQNEPDITDQPEKLGEKLEEIFEELWQKIFK